ncbi:MAG: hypothetical protein EBY16_03335 [Gammaproteobacteria bacterium]|nr:hypothetical protein [Gammaproteobacteria bacterium]
MDTSKLPDLNEISNMAGKLFGDVKKSIGEIIDEYKAKHPHEESVAKPECKIEPGKTDSETSQVKDKKTTKEE